MTEAKASGLRVCAAGDLRLGVVSVPALGPRYWHSVSTGYLCSALCFLSFYCSIQCYLATFILHGHLGKGPQPVL